MCVRIWWAHTCVYCREKFATQTFQCDGDPLSHESADYKSRDRAVVKKGREDRECRNCDGGTLARVLDEIIEEMEAGSGAETGDGDYMDIDHIGPAIGDEDEMELMELMEGHFLSDDSDTETGGGDAMDIDYPEDPMDWQHVLTYYVCVCALVGKASWECECM